MQPIYLFSGPSLTRDYAKQRIASTGAIIELRHPVRQGDILRILADKPKAIGITDGFFFQQPAVHFKEILLALEQGIPVFGAASMGALRAAELSVYGMVGIGKIFQMYAAGKIDGDDEVAVAHAGPETGFRTMSEALINIRINVENARKARILDRAAATKIISTAKRQHFSERSFSLLLAKLSGTAIDKKTIRAFEKYLSENYVDQKEKDCLELLEYLIRVSGNADQIRQVPKVKTPRTSFLLSYEKQYIGRRHGGVFISDHRVWALKKLLFTGFEETWREHVVRCIAIDEARSRGFSPPDQKILVEKFRNDSNLGNEDQFNEWLLRHHMELNELGVFHQEEWLETTLIEFHGGQDHDKREFPSFTDWVTYTAAFRHGVSTEFLLGRIENQSGMAWEAPMLRKEKATGSFNEAAKHALRIYTFNASMEKSSAGVVSRLNPEGLEIWFASQWRVSKENFVGSARKRGFYSHRELLEVSRIGFLYDAFKNKPTVEMANTRAAD